MGAQRAILGTSWYQGLSLSLSTYYTVLGREQQRHGYYPQPWLAPTIEQTDQ